mmetsp:Transcript_77922/g.95427  ORF Transcript_77922/g.95427 Transcript_77922/m.95427 type:complete len:550 (-) Transcript_77922:233-1882(-)
MSFFFVFACLKTVVIGLSGDEFTEFRDKVLYLINVNPDNKGITPDDPRVTPLDFAGGLRLRGIQSGLIRLAFHDCAGIDITIDDKTQFYSNDNTNIGGCNGCININNHENDDLWNTAIEPISDICDEYNINYGLSISDCWMLSATIAVENAAGLLATLNPNSTGFGEGLVVPFEDRYIAVNPNEIKYYYGRKDCPTSPFHDKMFLFPDAVEWSWNDIELYFKSRFNMTNKDIVSLIMAGHSVGNAFQNISGLTGIWDFSDDILDFYFVSRLFNEDLESRAFLSIIGNTPVETVYYQRIIDPNPKYEAKKQWCFNYTDFADEFFQLTPRFGTNCFEMAFNTDISIVYDLSWYHENGLNQDIDCYTNTTILCNDGDIILTAKRGNSSINKMELNDEIYECPVNETCCPYIQCPIQCNGGINKFNEYLLNIDTIDPDLDCPAIYAKKYSHMLSVNHTYNNRKMGIDFIESWTKMITIGYVDQNGNVLLNEIIIDDNNDLTSTNQNKLFIILLVVTMFVLIALLAIFAKYRENARKNSKHDALNSENNTEYGT